MTALNTYRRWLARVEDDALRAELSALDEVRDAAQIEDRFYRDLAFGTGGLRGVLGAGTNRMNVYVVRRATQGLAAYLKAAGLPLRCAIAYDSRIGSARFARETARVLAANGVTAYLYPRLEPTPALSWAVRYYGCGAGVCVTASHNPAAYNGYKVYGPDGCQITLEAADAVSKHIGAADHFDGVRLCGFADALADGTIRMIGEDCLEAFLDAVERRSVWDGDRSALRVVYTPLNGTGRECVTKILRRIDHGHPHRQGAGAVCGGRCHRGTDEWPPRLREVRRKLPHHQQEEQGRGRVRPVRRQDRHPQGRPARNRAGSFESLP